MRIRWLPVQTELSEAQFLKALRTMPFEHTAAPLCRGFRLQSASKGRISGQYIEQQVSDRLVVLPDGTEVQQELLEVTVTDFRVDEARGLGLEIRNAPRSLSSFVAALGAATGFRVSVDSRLRIDLLRSISAFRRAIGVSAKVTAIECSGVRVKPDVVGALSITGAVDVLKAFDELPFARRTASIDSARLEFDLNGERHVVEMSKTGTTRLRGHDMEHVASCVRVAFEAAVVS